jgi:hypothetical protein
LGGTLGDSSDLGPSKNAPMAEESTLHGSVVELIDELKAQAERLTGAGLDEASLREGYKWIFSILAVGLDAHVWADTGRPRFVDIVGPYRKWGGDNADAYYQYAPLDPTRTYHITGKRGDAVYLSMTVYGGPNDGRYSDRIVGTVNDRMLDFAEDGSFSATLSPAAFDGAGVTLEPDAVCVITRDYLADPVNGQRATFRIEAVDPPTVFAQDDADLERRMRAALTWLRQQAAMVPVSFGVVNDVLDPFPVPSQTFGWAAGDAAYAMGSFELGPDEALIIEGRSPECSFWNMCLWNPFMHTYNYDYARVTISGEQAVLNEDGSWTLVIAGRDPGHPNWVSTEGHASGRIFFRWFFPAHTPERPTVRLERLEPLA